MYSTMNGVIDFTTKPEKMRVRVFIEGYTDPNRIVEMLDRLYNSTRAKKMNRVYLTANNDFTHAILINYAMPDLTISRDNVIGFAHVNMRKNSPSPAFIAYAQKHVRKYFIGDIDELHNPWETSMDPFCEGRVFPMYSPITTPLKTTKTKLMSISATLNLNTPGHKYRRKLVARIIESTLPIDVYGHGCIEYQSNEDKRICGTYPESCPAIMYDDYMYHITMENYSSNAQYSEKLVDALVRGTIPVYNGSVIVKEIYSNMIVPLCGNIDADFALLHDIVRDPMRFYKSVDAHTVKQKENLLAHLPQLFG